MTMAYTCLRELERANKFLEEIELEKVEFIVKIRGKYNTRLEKEPKRRKVQQRNLQKLYQSSLIT